MRQGGTPRGSGRGGTPRGRGAASPADRYGVGTPHGRGAASPADRGGGTPRGRGTRSPADRYSRGVATRGGEHYSGGASLRTFFPEHFEPEHALAGLSHGALLVGFLRINAKRPRKEAYAHVSGLPVDVYIDGDDRNRALEGDCVVIELLPTEEWNCRRSTAGASGVAAAANDGESSSEPLQSLESQFAAAVHVGDAEAPAAELVGGGASPAEHGAIIGVIAPAAAAAAGVADPISARADEALGSASEAPDNTLALPSAAAAAVTQRLYRPVDFVLAAQPAAGPAAAAEEEGEGGEEGAPAAAASRSNRSLLPAFVAAAVASPGYKAGLARTLVGVLHGPAAAPLSPVPPPPAAPGQTVWQPRGRVVGIAAFGHPRTVVGTLLPASDAAPLDAPVSGRDAFVRLSPLDGRVPFVVIPRTDVPESARGFFARPADHARTLFAAVITRWDAAHRFPAGTLRGALGEAGEIAAETTALLYTNGVRDEPFSPEVMACLERFDCGGGGGGVSNGGSSSGGSSSGSSEAAAAAGPRRMWRIPPAELAARRDLRRTRIFTCDPTNAKDLDDALHITPLPGGDYEVGVHIADVSYFITPGTALDDEAAARATSVYLVQRVIPMLPSLLCEELCSLNPGVDRLAFSAVWTMTADGDLSPDRPPWFGRTVIRSVAKLDYATAQRMIDGTISEAAAEAEDRAVVLASSGGAEGGGGSTTSSSSPPPPRLSAADWDPARRPGAAADAAGSEVLYALGGGGAGAAAVVRHGCADVVRDVVLMARIAMARRRRRFAAGALALNKSKLVLTLDRATGNPTGVGTYPIRDSNRMIEEYMLLANYLVAQRLLASAGRAAVLRAHPPIQGDKAGAVVALAAELGFPNFRVDTAGGIHNSLLAVYARNHLAGRVLEYMVTKPMKPAKYLVAGDDPTPAGWRHYALAMPCYTHFTSPIRRYADVMVHRQLYRAILQAQTNRPTASLPASGGGAWADVDAAAVSEAPGAAELVTEEADALSAQCEVCNDRKAAAKDAQEASDAVYLSVYLRAAGPLVTDAVCVDASGDKFFTLLLPLLDLERRVYFDRCGLVAAAVAAGGGAGAAKHVVARRATPLEFLQGSSGGGAGAALLAGGMPAALAAEREAAAHSVSARGPPSSAPAALEADEGDDGSEGEGDEDAAAVAAGSALSKRKLRNIVRWARRHPAEAETHLGLRLGSDIPAAGSGAGAKDAAFDAVRRLVAERGAAFFADALKAADAAAAAAQAAAASAPARASAASPAAAAVAAPGGGGVATAVMSRKGVIPQVVPGASLFPPGRDELLIRPMTRFRVQLVAVADRVPIDSDVQLIELLS